MVICDETGWMMVGDVRSRETGSRARSGSSSNNAQEGAEERRPRGEESLELSKATAQKKQADGEG